MAIEGINNCERCGDEGWIVGEMGITRCACSQDGALTNEDTKQVEPVTTANKLGNSPALSVWYGCMPETNGKTNWTAILYRNGGCISNGITIDISEYPDRVRYEADRMRHLIGELKEEPDILKYDADAHSGYVSPREVAGNSPVIPDTWIPVSERLPEEGGRYWCYVEEQNSLGKSHYQWNCSWNGEIWGGAMMHGRVTHWMPLPNPPKEVK
ncbi:DUF551 domain-containing protein [Klebsiella aerogenes]